MTTFCKTRLCLLAWFLPGWMFAAGDFTISLQNETLEVPGFAYRIQQVRDNREQTYCIGMVQRGMGNRRTPAFLEKGVSGEMMQLFAQSFPKNNALEALEVWVNRLQIYEITYANREVAIVEINLSFVQRYGDVSVEIFETGATIERSGILDVTRSHDKNIARAIEYCLKKLMDCRFQGKLGGRTLSETGEFPPYPILNASELRAGIIHTFNDFRNNAAVEEPAFPYALKVKENRKNPIVQARPEWLRAEPDAEPWGLSDGRYIYINLGQGYFRLTQEGDDFILYGPAPKDNGSAVFLGAAFGGILGAVIVGLIEAPLDTRNMTKYKVDMYTGALVPFEEPVYRRIESRLLFVCSDFNDKNSRLEITVEGKPLNSAMGPGTCQRTKLLPPERPVDICVTSGDVQYCETITPELFKTTVALIRFKKGKIHIDWPGGDTRSRLIRESKDGTLKIAGE